MSNADESTDRIEREIWVDAPVEGVWRLISEPGWWIGGGDPDNRTVVHEEQRVVVDFPPHGHFPVATVATEPPHYVAYRASDDPGQPLAEGSSTLVEFFLVAAVKGTRLRVVESGFTTFSPSATGRAAAIEDTTHGWEVQLGLAKQALENGAR